MLNSIDEKIRDEYRRLIKKWPRLPTIVTDEEFDVLKSMGRDMRRYVKLSEWVTKHRNTLRTAIKIERFVTQQDNQK